MAPYTSGTNYLKGHLLNENKRSKVKFPLFGRNCLFRALGDQLEGHGRNHYKHRHDVVNYMVEHREDFEPFVEDDVPFDRHSKAFYNIVCMF